jgi:hypothetical protein
MKTVTTKSSKQITADFLTIFQNVKSNTEAKPVTPQDRMKPYRKEILKLRRRGLSWKQIARGMRQPPINERVSTKLLSAVFGAAQQPAAKTTRPIPDSPTPPVAQQ